ncbi:MAG: SRPBCC domain-containing protein [Candidatus Acidiferrales bacterium]
MVPSNVAPGEDEIISEIQIAASPERVFQALVDPQQVVQWWGQGGVYRCTEFHSDLRAGGKWRSAGVGPDGGGFEVTGEYLEIDRPRLLVYSWIASWTGDAKTVVRWELESTRRGTLLRIRHSGLAAHPGLGQSYRGWLRMLGWLQAYLERGDTVDDRKSASAT